MWDHGIDSILHTGRLRLVVTPVLAPWREHNPNEADGRAGLIAYIQYLSSHNRDTFASNRCRLVDENLVAAHSIYAQGPSKKVVLDLFSFESLAAVEHWDSIQNWEEEIAIGRTMTDGHAILLDRGGAETNRVLVRRFYDEVIIGGKLESVDAFLTLSYAQHNPRIKDGLEGLSSFFGYLEARNVDFQLLKTYPSFAEGHSAFLHSEARVSGTPHAFFDLFRVQGGRIVEHWDVVQPVPNEMARNNGMFEFRHPRRGALSAKKTEILPNMS